MGVLLGYFLMDAMLTGQDFEYIFVSFIDSYFHPQWVKAVVTVLLSCYGIATLLPWISVTGRSKSVWYFSSYIFSPNHNHLSLRCPPEAVLLSPAHHTLWTTADCLWNLSKMLVWLAVFFLYELLLVGLFILYFFFIKFAKMHLCIWVFPSHQTNN